MNDIPITDWDCLIVGGGPAGLTAATYLARFRRRALLVDDGASRAAAIPASHNHPGFTKISGPDLLKLMYRQAQLYGVELRTGKVEALRRHDTAFVAEISGELIRAQRVLLATGIKDVAPELPGLDQALARSVVRYCPICDGYEARGKKIAVFGDLDHSIKEAAFLRTYSSSVTLLYAGAADRARAGGALACCGAVIASAPIRRFHSKGSGLTAELESGDFLQFDVLYPALGCVVHSGLAKALGARCDTAGCISVDQKQRTSLEGLYAAGDVVSDLHQISVAEGHAAIAATAIHNSLPRNFM